ncbi:2-oxoglutarate dehydrogenase E1 component [Alicyclobacillus tolerans]|uniref:2-oxoglutarate dehydrogenase E1 component n=1 Tax=Alicyclobacillus tolerans TaxID=90970 RepID=UPI001EFFCC6B|nr:2-oxoglutarate dehydrogenase E1 component [Alicyclobacillus tolerans]MCF8565492.1 2-oxoglutarate dehydrogenase E1 component [Alicyclobacillus tolerans]
MATSLTSSFYGANLGYLLEQYDQYEQDPRSVSESTRKFFEQLRMDGWRAQNFTFYELKTADVEQRDRTVKTGPSDEPSGDTGKQTKDLGRISDIVGVVELARNIRQNGHLAAHFNPLQESQKLSAMFQIGTYHLTEQALRTMPAEIIVGPADQDLRSAWDSILRLKEVYMSDLAFEFAHVNPMEEQAWLYHMAEAVLPQWKLSVAKRKALLQRLSEVEAFERFLHKTFPGQKRFSIEGVDALVPMMDRLVHDAVSQGVQDIVIGMAHRGRLSVLAHVLGKPYQAIFSEFQHAPNKELVPSEGSMGINYGWTGDVKYHLGAYRTLNLAPDVRQKQGPVLAHLRLAHNPSHLEFVNPVVAGMTRAAQDERSSGGSPKRNALQSLAVLVHGDAAFSGEGVVAESLNLSRLPGYETGGTIHVIANNLLGFTAEGQEVRSTLYASDLAKGFEIPIVHVSADNPEACLTAIQFAYAYRTKFHKDFLIDLVGYRRFGHNEMDDPTVTQPQLYAKINRHKTVRELYAEQLGSAGLVDPKTAQSMVEASTEKLRQEYQKVSELRPDHDSQNECLTPSEPRFVPISELQRLNDALLQRPEGFTVYPKLERILSRRRDAFSGSGRIDWAHAESLAFAAILADGMPIRLTGQDSERGTFAQRHMVVHDFQTGTRYVPLQHLPGVEATFDIHNSPVTEGAVLGFEYGYSVQAPGTLVIWEAQFGDFANAAQVLIDQFLAAGQAKWKQDSGLVLLLPHGYEGQGPEHSSARLERFLQLAAHHNCTVANVSTAAQYYHLLRTQAANLTHKPVPLIVMTPKSLLRNPRSSSRPSDLSEGSFQPVLDAGSERLPVEADRVSRLILCSGKVSIDLEEAMEKTPPEGDGSIACARLEQLYPFPKSEIARVLKRYRNLREVVWLQEEPMNMGAWTYVRPCLEEMLSPSVQLRYVGRTEQASPAEGQAGDHNREQARLLRDAIAPMNVNARTPVNGTGVSQDAVLGGVWNE